MDIILKSAASAGVTAIILLIARYAGPKLAGAIGGIPVVFAISYVILTLENKGIARDFLTGGIYGAVAAIFFSVLLIWLNKQFLQSHWINFVIAYVLCFLLAFFLAQFTSKT
ncbi:MAG: hypothetical protein Q7R93_02715 [bacterium]|nr:hypothetical protein [bacterium]